MHFISPPKCNRDSKPRHGRKQIRFDRITSPPLCTTDRRRGEERHKAAREARSYSEFNYRTGRCRALSSQRSRPESRPPLTARLFGLSLGERTTFPDWDLASRTPSWTGAHRPVYPRTTPPPPFESPPWGESVKRVSHLEESLWTKHFVGLPVVVAVKPVKLEVMCLYF